jgi:hypothetical protein
MNQRPRTDSPGARGVFLAQNTMYERETEFPLLGRRPFGMVNGSMPLVSELLLRIRQLATWFHCRAHRT